MNQINRFFLLMSAIGVLFPLAAWAKPEIKIAIKAEKEVVVTENGKQIKKVIEAKELLPGETVTYTISYANLGNEPATNVQLDDPIPAGTRYIPGSASDEANASFSIDGGKSYKKPALLTYEVTLPNGMKEKKVASPEQYTNIRWTLPSVAPGAKGTIIFKAILNQ